MAQASSSEDDLSAAPHDLLDQYGTPPTRSAVWAVKAAGRGGSSKAKAPGNVSKSARNSRRKAARQKERAGARAFKVLDPMLLDVLGIDDAQRDIAAPADTLNSPASANLLPTSSSNGDLLHGPINAAQGPAEYSRHNHRTPSTKSRHARASSGSGGERGHASNSRPQSHHHRPQAAAASRNTAQQPAIGGVTNHQPAPGVARLMLESAGHSPAAASQVRTGRTITMPNAPSFAMAVSTVPARPPSAPLLPAGRGNNIQLPSPTPAGNKRQHSSTRGSGSTNGLPSPVPSNASTDLSARDKVVQDREAWLARINDVLVGKSDVDDDDMLGSGADRALAEAQEDAATLKEQLIVLQTPATGWQQLEDRLKWLEDCRARAGTIVRKLQPHRNALDSRQLASVVNEYNGELAALADLCSLTASECLEKLPETLRGEDDIRQAVRTSARTIHACVQLAKDSRDEANLLASGLDGRSGSSHALDTSPPLLTGTRQPSLGDLLHASTVGADLEHAAVRVVEAAMQASRQLASELLVAASLVPPVGHATASRVKCMQALWRGTTDLIGRVLRCWDRQQLALNRRLAEMYNEAASSALCMVLDCMCNRLGCTPPRDSQTLLESVVGVLVDLEENGGLAATSNASSLIGSMVIGSAASSGGPIPRPLHMLPTSGTQRNGRPAGIAKSGNSMTGGANGRYPGSAWGVNNPGGRMPSPVASLSDEELLAHSWVPGLLLDLHARTAATHKKLRELLLASTQSSGLSQFPSMNNPSSSSGRRGMRASSTGSTALISLSSGEEIELFSLLDNLQEQFSALVLANLQRTAWLCGTAVAPAMWALEVLRDQAENALRLAKAYDAGSLGLEELLVEALEELAEAGMGDDTMSEMGYSESDTISEAGSMGPVRRAAPNSRSQMTVVPDRLRAVQKLFELLKKASDRVVDTLLHIRRLLRVRRGDQDDLGAGLPARLPAMPLTAGPPIQPNTPQLVAPSSAHPSPPTTPLLASMQHPTTHAQLADTESATPAAAQRQHSNAKGSMPPPPPPRPRASSPFAAASQRLDFNSNGSFQVPPAGPNMNLPPAAVNMMPNGTHHRSPAKPSASPFSRANPDNAQNRTQPAAAAQPAVAIPFQLPGPSTKSPFSQTPFSTNSVLLPVEPPPQNPLQSDALPAALTALSLVQGMGEGAQQQQDTLVQQQQQHTLQPELPVAAELGQAENNKLSDVRLQPDQQARLSSWRSILAPQQHAGRPPQAIEPPDPPDTFNNNKQQPPMGARPGSLLTMQLQQGMPNSPPVTLPTGNQAMAGIKEVADEVEQGDCDTSDSASWQQAKSRRRGKPAQTTADSVQAQPGSAQIDSGRGRRGGSSRGRGGRGRGGMMGRGSLSDRNGFAVTEPNNWGVPMSGDIPHRIAPGLQSPGSASSSSSGMVPVVAPNLPAAVATYPVAATHTARPIPTGRVSAFAGFAPPSIAACNGQSPCSTPKLSSSPVQAPASHTTRHPRRTTPSPFSHNPPLFPLSRNNSGTLPVHQQPQHQTAAGQPSNQQVQMAALSHLAAQTHGMTALTTNQPTAVVSNGAQRTSSQAGRQQQPAANGLHLAPAAPSHSITANGVTLQDTDFWAIPFSVLRATLKEKLGSGSFGTVWTGRYYEAEVAIKVVTIDRNTDFDERALARFKREVDFQRQLSHHPNIVRFIGACCEYEQARNNANLDVGDSKPMLAIVMEFCRLGNLNRMISRARAVGRSMLEPGANPQGIARANSSAYAFYSSWETRLQVAAGAAAGVQFMHNHNVIHRDLTSNNLVLDRVLEGQHNKTVWVAKVCDFNLSRALPRTHTRLTHSGRIYSPLWASPELLRGSAFGKEADVYSFGIILYECLTLNVPYASIITDGVPYHADLTETQISVITCHVQQDVPKGLRPDLPETYSGLAGPPLHTDPDVAATQYARLKKLILECWAADPLQRPTMAKVAFELGEVLTAIKRRPD